MKKLALLFLFLLVFSKLSAQVNSQMRYHSDERTYYVWNEEKQDYDFKENEFEHSIIEIREIGSRTNGYVAITLIDDGKVRLYHGSIKDYKVDDNNEATWSIFSKNKRGKLIYNEKKQTFSFSFESDEKRYLKIFIFKLKEGTVAELD